MSLAAGARLGPYEILGLIGAGGMGEVYKATDTRLGRIVAVKILPPEIADAEHRARFEREARTIATLSHPHICTLYDVGEHSSSLFLVMEHLAGETLAGRLRRGALPIDQALELGGQIAEALAAAHRSGIIHRDLKPANVMLTKTGVKLLDFGLAKLKRDVLQATTAAATGVPTRTEPLTGEGTILGTLEYMAPEQLEGKEADARTDIWALGLVLYEMLTGKRAFEAQSTASLIAAILERTPTTVSTLQPLTPPALDRIVGRAMAKDPDARWQDARDLADELRWISSVSREAQDVQRARLRPSVRVVFVATAAVALVLAAIAAFWWATRREPTATPRVQRYEISIAPAEALRGYDEREVRYYAGRPTRLAFALSPDEHWLVFTARQGARQGLWVRDLASGEARLLPNTDGAEGPFFSPDGRQVGFWANGAIRKIDVTGGPINTICDSEPLQGAVWGEDGTVIFARLSGPLLQVPDGGGIPVPITKLQGREGGHSLPQRLPDGHTILYTADPWPYRIIAEDLRSHHQVELLKGDATRGEISDARYISTGHLIYARHGTIEAVPFDVRTPAVTGAAVAVLDDVMESWGGGSADLDIGVMQAVVTLTGSLFYVSGGVVPPATSTLMWRDLMGRGETLIQLPHYVESLRISPDGTHVALTADDYPGAPLVRIAVLDLTTKTVMPVTNLDASAFHAIWTPDGRRLTFSYSARPAEEGFGNLFTMPADGSTPPVRLTTSDHVQMAQCWTREGRTLIYDEQHPTTRDDLWMLWTDAGNVSAKPFLQTNDREMAAEISPDGKWLAYLLGQVSAAGVQGAAGMHIYVRGFSSPGGGVRISVESATAPVWSPDGRTVYYSAVRRNSNAPPRAMIAVDMADGRPVPGRPQRELFTGTWSSINSFRSYDLSPDGRRFLFPEDVPVPPQTISRINVVLNWTEELKAKARAR